MIAGPLELEKLLTGNHTTLHHENVNGRILAVKETTDYRWFEYAGPSIQSLMNKTAPEQISTPVSQSLLTFLLFDIKPANVLSLGLGGASIERALAHVPGLVLTSVEYCQPIIDMAKRYFYVPAKTHIICESAEQFVQRTESKYDVVLCDLFFEEKNPDFLYAEHFYSQLNEITSREAVVMINTQAESETQLLGALFAIREFFPHIALIEFDGYKNIVIIASSHEIPGRARLRARLASFTHVAFFRLDEVIERLRYLPQ